MTIKASVLDKVRAMLTLAESERELGHEETADAHTATAARWMAKYGIDRALAEAKAESRSKPGDRKFRIKAPYADCKRVLLSVVAGAFGCHCILLNGRGPDEVSHVFGFDTDIEQADMLYTSLLLQMSAALRRHSIPGYITGRRLMAERRSFMLGFATGVKPRLEAAYAQAVAEADDSGTKGKGLVLASREIAVKDAMAAEYPTVRTVRVTSRGGSYGPGLDAGTRANIHDRPNVGSGSGRLLSR